MPGKATTVAATRTEKDSLGAIEVPSERYYGVQTARAVENFPISGLRLPRRFIRAQGIIKAAAAHANLKCGVLEKAKAEAIQKAAHEVAHGKWDTEFVVDVYQAGAGTSQNMNANEVIANRALEILGHAKGAYEVVSPNDDVNRSQSTNDTIPTAILLSAREALEADLRPALARLIKELEKKAKAFGKVIKAGRTHLQDATPITLGQEFSAYVHFLREADRRVAAASEALSFLPLGGTAVGTGINAPPGYDEHAVADIARFTGLEFRVTPNKFAGQQNVEAALEASSALRSLATALNKVADDFRLLASGPRTGFYEIELPAVQPGSSIMPGKVNPVLAEMLNMVCEQAFGHDATIHHAVRSAQLELNVMMPVIGYNLLQSVHILTNAMEAFRARAVAGLKVNEEICRMYLDRSLMLVTALTPKIGYLKAAEVAKEAMAKNKTLKQVLLDKKLLPEKEIDALLDPWKMLEPGAKGGGA
jgi:fumarate hydratase, class II